MPITGPAALRDRRFRPALWPTLAAAVVIAATVLLGNWQARRADLRGSLQERAQAMAAQPPLTLLRSAEAGPEHRYRRAVAAGNYVAARQIWLDNRTYKGVAGYHVLTPLRLDDGTHLLVDRGWIAATVRHEPPAASPQTVESTVTSSHLPCNAGSGSPSSARSVTLGNGWGTSSVP